MTLLRDRENQPEGQGNKLLTRCEDKMHFPQKNITEIRTELSASQTAEEKCREVQKTGTSNHCSSAHPLQHSTSNQRGILHQIKKIQRSCGTHAMVRVAFITVSTRNLAIRTFRHQTYYRWLEQQRSDVCPRPFGDDHDLLPKRDHSSARPE